MKRLILMGASLAIFGGAAYLGSTGAFFSDSETSLANTFTAGAIDLKVDSTQHYNGNVCTLVTANASSSYEWVGISSYPVAGTACSGTWTLKDLDPTLDKFFNFPDVKPGDEGENTVSLHIDNNDAYACVDISNIQNNDNTQTEPEALVDVNGLTTGELAQNLNFIVWKDEGATPGFQGSAIDPTEGDNIWQAGEPLITSGTAPTANQSYTLANSVTGPLTGGSTGYVGVEWCAGTWSSVAPGATCSGSNMGNDVQTDSYAADVSFRVEQARNNPNFTCSAPVDGNPNEINQSDLATTTADAAGKWFFYNDDNDTVMTPDQFSGTGGQDHMASIAGEAGAKMVLDTNPNARYNIATGQFGGTLLNAISTIKFRVYDATADSDTPFIQFNVDFATSTVAAGYEGRLTMQPGSSTNAPLAPATWTTVDAKNGGNAMWTWSKFAKGPNLVTGGGDDNKWPDGNTNEYRTWNDIVTSIPTAKLLSPGSFLGVRDGQPGPIGATDYVSSIEFNGTVYNFEL